jgi:hypothetical protein
VTNCVLWLIVSLLAASSDSVPHRFAFAQIRAESRLHGAPALPRLSDPRARRYRTVLREAAKEGPNFNLWKHGHPALLGTEALRY